MMIVRCITNSKDALFESERAAYGGDKKSIMGITAGKDYVVFAIAGSATGIDYAIQDDDVEYYPMFYPSKLFEVVDSVIPDGWISSYLPDRSYPFLCSFPEWVESGDDSESGFYGRLVDSSYDTQEIWENYKRLYIKK